MLGVEPSKQDIQEYLPSFDNKKFEFRMKYNPTLSEVKQVLQKLLY